MLPFFNILLDIDLYVLLSTKITYQLFFNNVII